jgi:hypothetical protein
MVDRRSLTPTLPLLISESREEFDQLYAAIRQEIRPNGPIERMFVSDLCANVWERGRLRRAKAGIINSKFRAALEHLLQHTYPDHDSHAHREAGRLSCEWFTDKTTKKQITAILAQFKLDESTIEAEAIRLAADDLERIDRIVASLEARFARLLRNVTEYRESLCQQFRAIAENVIEAKPVRQLEGGSSKQQKAA